METTPVSGLALFYDAAEKDAAGLIGQAVNESVHLIQKEWGLEVPADGRVYVMTSWRHFVFHSASWAWKVLLAVTYPLWSPRVRRIWAMAGGWNQHYGKRTATGVKPARLMKEAATTNPGEQIFVQVDDIRDKVRHVTCHELVHAFTSYLKLPVWLHERLAMVTVDLLAGTPTVRADTQAVLADGSVGWQSRPRTADAEALVREYARSYWVTRYLAETKPELLQSVLEKRRSHQQLEGKLAAQYGLAEDEFWRIQAQAAAHFG